MIRSERNSIIIVFRGRSTIYKGMQSKSHIKSDLFHSSVHLVL